jgi:AmmeMemoRadiSam system protein B
VAGSASPEHVASVLDMTWGGDETLVIASSDLSHYHRYEAARMIDASTCGSIHAFDARLSDEQACGAVAINGLLHLARTRGLALTELARCNSGDTAGDRSRVVGYAAFALHEGRKYTARGTPP